MAGMSIAWSENAGAWYPIISIGSVGFGQVISAVRASVCGGSTGIVGSNRPRSQSP